jgi:SAM-dependent methyltransferase
VSALSTSELERIRRSRRFPALTQFDYLHVRRLVDDLQSALHRVARPGDRILDVWSGSRPYDDLLPPAADLVSLDVEGNPYGIADVVSNDLLPFSDHSFDVVMCIQAFDFVPDPVTAIREFHRVLRPGGAVVVSVPYVWEYERLGHERRYTGPELAGLFADWNDVAVVENGGRAVAWATLTSSLVASVERQLFSGGVLRIVAHPLFALVYAGVNLLGLGIDAAERRFAAGSHALPMNLLLTARREKR